MTVISAFISKLGTSIASDSLITELTDDRVRKAIEDQQSKIVRIPKFHGTASYWGLALYGQWSTYNWLQNQALEAEDFETFEEFANSFRNNLENELSHLNFQQPMHGGIGIHLTGYEYINGHWIPELFLCSNFADTSYSRLCCLHLSRETYHIMSNKGARERHRWPSKKHGKSKYRMAVFKRLQKGQYLRYNNGDPLMFNLAGNTLIDLMQVLRKRQIFKGTDKLEIQRSITKWPIEVVSYIQENFCKDDTKSVGGHIHSVAVTPDGRYLDEA
ncbi:MAG: hypothetical protein AB1631_10060 [Acidobacteriota bacterium]